MILSLNFHQLLLEIYDQKKPSSLNFVPECQTWMISLVTDVFMLFVQSWGETPMKIPSKFLY